MTNGNGINGAGQQVPQTVNVSPVQAAAFALQFLPRAPHTHAEREAFDVATMFLQAICQGQLVMAQAPQQVAPQLLPGEAAPAAQPQ